MNWPPLVDAKMCTVPITLSLTDGVNRDGSPKVVLTVETTCNYSEKMRQILDAERRIITLESVALFPGDVAPELAELEGTAAVGGKERTIYRASRARNPDGTVNFTQLELM